MKTTNTPETPLATNKGTTHPPQPGPLEAQLAEKLGISREQLARVFAGIKNRFKSVGWDLDVMPPDNSKTPGSEDMFWLVLSGFRALDKQNPWEYESTLRQMDKLIKGPVVSLGNLLAQPPPGASERLELSEAAEAQVDRRLMALAQRKDLTPTERVRMLALLGKRERSLRRRMERFYVDSTKALQKKKKRAR